MFRRLAPIFSVVAAAVAEILQVGRSFEHYPGWEPVSPCDKREAFAGMVQLG
jgi:hypothetical protein